MPILRHRKADHTQTHAISTCVQPFSEIPPKNLDFGAHSQPLRSARSVPRSRQTTSPSSPTTAPARCRPAGLPLAVEWRGQ